MMQNSGKHQYKNNLRSYSLDEISCSVCGTVAEAVVAVVVAVCNVIMVTSRIVEEQVLCNSR